MQAAPLLFQGFLTTLQLWIWAIVLALMVGVTSGIWRSSRLRMAYFSTILDVATFVLRGVPFFVQLSIAYFVLPSILGIDVPGYIAAAVSLGLCSAAFVSQIVRGGIDAIDVGQWEAAQVLGYDTKQTLRYIIMPQVMKNVLPSLLGEIDQLLKSTAIFSTIGILELTGAAKNIIAQEMNPIAMYSAIAVLYLCLSSLLGLVTRSVRKSSTCDWIFGLMQV